MAALQSAIANAGSPRGAKLVSDDLDLDVMRSMRKLLEKHCGVAKGLEGFGTGTLKSQRHLFQRVDFTNASPTAPGCGFNKEWESECLCFSHRVGERLDGASAPGYDGDVSLLGKTFGRNFVAHA